MSPLYGDLRSRWVRWVVLVYNICVYFRAVASPTKLFFQRQKGYNFQKIFHDGGLCSFSLTVGC